MRTLGHTRVSTDDSRDYATGNTRYKAQQILNDRRRVHEVSAFHWHSSRGDACHHEMEHDTTGQFGKRPYIGGTLKATSVICDTSDRLTLYVAELSDVKALFRTFK